MSILKPGGMVTYYQNNLDEKVKKLAEAIARGDIPSRIAMFERWVIESRAKLEREQAIASGKLPKGKRETFAMIRHRREDKWFSVDKIVRTPFSDPDDAYFIGVGQGFDILRILSYSSGADDALEVAEEKLPRRVPEDAEIRILTKALRVAKGVSLGAGDARLVGGEDIRYT